MKLSRPNATPCRVGHAKRNGDSDREHTCSHEHRALVESYREARETWLDKRDAECVGYTTEYRAYAERNGPGPTFKQFLQKR